MGDPQEVWFSANGLRFRGLEWLGNGPTALLIHATSFCAEVWRPAWEAARKAGAADLHAVAVDQRGHGRTAAPGDAAGFAWPNLMADAVALAAALAGRHGRAEAGGPSDTPTLLVGHSSGATAALAAAGHAPDRVRAVAAIEPVLFEVKPRGGDVDSFAGSRVLTERARRRRARFASVEEARRELGARFPYSGFHPDALAAFLEGGLERAADGSVALRCQPHHEAAAYAGAVALDLWPLVARIRAPVLLVLAEHSAVPPPLAERLLRELGGVRVERIPGATHFAVLERPDEVGQALGSFVAEKARDRARPSHRGRYTRTS